MLILCHNSQKQQQQHGWPKLGKSDTVETATSEQKNSKKASEFQVFNQTWTSPSHKHINNGAKTIIKISSHYFIKRRPIWKKKILVWFPGSSFGFTFLLSSPIHIYQSNGNKGQPRYLQTSSVLNNSNVKSLPINYWGKFSVFTAYNL